MHVALRCPCGANLKAPVKYVGRELKCPKCSKMLVVPEPPMAATSQPAELEVLEPYDISAEAAPLPHQPAPMPMPAATGPAAKPRKPAKSGNKFVLLPYLIGVGVLLIGGAGVYLYLEYQKAVPKKERVVVKGADGKALTSAELDQLKATAPLPSAPPVVNRFDSGEMDLVSQRRGRNREPLAFNALVKKVDPSIVRIFVEATDGSEKVGSGFFVDTEGKIVTNHHVIENGSKVTVETEDGKRAEALGYLVRDSKIDLAIIQVDPDYFDSVPLPLASNLPEKGDNVAAFGAPAGFGFSNSQGNVSSIRSGDDIAKILNEMSPGSYDNHGFTRDITWLQHTAAISGGNSGGPLVNFQGELIGVNTWKHDGENLNFASTMESVRKIFGMRIKEDGKFMIRQFPKRR